MTSVQTAAGERGKNGVNTGSPKMTKRWREKKREREKERERERERENK